MPASATPICGLPRGDSTVRMCVHWRAGLQLNGCMSHLNSHHDFGHWFATGVLTPLLCSHHDFGHCFETGVVAPLSSEDSLFGISGGRHIWMPASATPICGLPGGDSLHGQDMRPLASRSAIKRVHVKHCMHCTPLHSHHAYGHNDWLETGVLTPLRCSHHDFGHCFETGVLAPLSSEVASLA